MIRESGMVKVYTEDGTPYWKFKDCAQSNGGRTDLPKVRVQIASGYARACVYAHSTDGVVFYVGSGSSIFRAFETYTRNDKWIEIVRAAGEYEVEILAWFKSRKDAYEYEFREIRERRPEANMYLGLPFSYVLKNKFPVRRTVSG